MTLLALLCSKDIRVPHLKSIFDLSYTRVMLIQFAFFSAYFLVFYSVGQSCEHNRLPENHGNRIGLYGRGRIFIFAGASLTSFPVFLGALIVLAAGIAGLQVGANPYVVVLGKPETASSRLDLAQGFNSLLAPKSRRMVDPWRRSSGCGRNEVSFAGCVASL